MEDEERPRKLPKLDHDDETAQKELGPAMTGAVVDEDAEQTGALVDENKDSKRSEPPDGTAPATADQSAMNNGTKDAVPPMSKNQLKKLHRRERWEQARAMRKDKRKEKLAEKRERRRQLIAEARQKGGDAAVAELRKKWESTKAKHQRSTLLPLTFVIDCGYDDLMLDNERISLAAQLTRAYSENSRARYRSHLMFTSFDKLLKERFDTVLTGYKNWKDIQLLPEDFVHAGHVAREQMVSIRGGELVGPFADRSDAKPEDGEIVYLSSESPHTLAELKPYSTYIIGGLVDRNRHKGICYSQAVEKGIKTAKLPIGDYVQMASRSVLATSHVVEIMLRWLELGDWGEAFMKVLPPRKGGRLKTKKHEDGGQSEDEEEEESEAVEEPGPAEVVEEADDEGEDA